MARGLHWLGATLFWLFVAGLAAWLLGLDDLVRRSIEAGHLLDWVMGALCFAWMLVILKAPWDLYFQAHVALWERERSRERGILIADDNAPADRDVYLRRVRRQLLWLAVGAHVASAVLVAAVAYANDGAAVGYYFAAFYLVSTVFRPAVAGYAYLAGKLRALGEEARYPREDILTLRAQVDGHEQALHNLAEQLEQCRDELRIEREGRDADVRTLHQRLHVIGREFEATIGRLTDNTEVIRGIQAFVRLVTQAGRVTGGDGT
jgi:hypothetical protein